MASDPVDRILAQWQRERPDLDASPMAIVGRMARLSKHLDRPIQAIFSDFGLRQGEFDVLATLRRSGQPYQLSPTELFNTMMVSSSTMTHRVDRLEQAALVECIPDPSDRRGTLIHLTPKGFDLIEAQGYGPCRKHASYPCTSGRSDREALALLLRKLLLSFE
ncbi:MAG: MarR family winged helix-turn-helix transcriptional regulator [Leptolyngbyaceae cyanobacterium]